MEAAATAESMVLASSHSSGLLGSLLSLFLSLFLSHWSRAVMSSLTESVCDQVMLQNHSSIPSLPLFRLF